MFKTKFAGVNRIFLSTVVAPTLIAIIYFGLIASDVYISESRFVVRSPERQSTSGFGLLLKGAGFSRSQDDSYTVQDFMLSRDALKELKEKLEIDKSFSNSSIDIFSRFSGLDWDDSFEALHRFYQKKIDIQLDSARPRSATSHPCTYRQTPQGIHRRAVSAASTHNLRRVARQ